MMEPAEKPGAESEDDAAPTSRNDHLADVVDDLEEKAADEQEAQGDSGKPSDRAQTQPQGSADEPPD